MIFDKFRGTSVDTSGVLRGGCCDDTCPIAAQRSERLQVRLKQAQESANGPVFTWIPAPPEGSLSVGAGAWARLAFLLLR